MKLVNTLVLGGNAFTFPNLSSPNLAMVNVCGIRRPASIQACC